MSRNNILTCETIAQMATGPSDGLKWGNASRSFLDRRDGEHSGVCQISATNPQEAPPTKGFPRALSSAAPSAKFLAIGHWSTAGTSSARTQILPSEMRRAAQLYLTGEVEQWYFTTDGAGIVLILNVANLDEAHELLDTLPLCRAGLMRFELISLGSLRTLVLSTSELSRGDVNDDL